MNNLERQKLIAIQCIISEMLNGQIGVEPKQSNDGLIYAAMRNSFIYNVDVRRLPLHPFSENWKRNIGNGTNVHFDFGSGAWEGVELGIPITIVTPDMVQQKVDFEYANECDPGTYFVGRREGGTDGHQIAITSDMVIHEICNYTNDKGELFALSGAKWNLTKSNQMRPAGWTSADAAGLPIAPLLLRRDEIEAGVINHPLRMTCPQTRGNVWPASHQTMGKLWDVADYNPPLGAWFRLKADFDITPFSRINQIILTALKEKGAIIADNGGSWFISGCPHPDWDNDDLSKLGDALRGGHLEAIDANCVMVAKDSYEARLI